MKKFSLFFVFLFLLMSCSSHMNPLNMLFEDWGRVEESLAEYDGFENNPAYSKFIEDFYSMCESSDFDNFRSIYFNSTENFFTEYVSAVKKGIENCDYNAIRKAVINFELVSKNQNSKASIYYLEIIIIFAVLFFLFLVFLFFILQKYERELDNVEQMGLYATFVMDSVEKERQRISKEIHDTVLQDIRLIELQADLLDRKSAQGSFEKTKITIKDLSRKTIEKLRNVCQNLTPSELKQVKDENTLITAINNLCVNFQEQYKIQCNFSIQSNIVMDVITVQKSMQIFRIVQEALNNIARHAEADCVTVVLKNFESEDGAKKLVFYITDDGKGFDVKSVNTNRHFGLSNMKERAKLIGAQFFIESDADAGTEIKLII